jgi:hypothetical protein
VPAGIDATSGKSAFFALLRPFVPGTLCCNFYGRERFAASIGTDAASYGSGAIRVDLTVDHSHYAACGFHLGEGVASDLDHSSESGVWHDISSLQI